MRVKHLAEIALGAGLPVSRSLHVQPDVRELWREGGRDEQRGFLGVGQVVLRQPVFVMGTLDGEAGDSWPEPGDAVLTVAGIVDWRRAAGGCEKAELAQRGGGGGGKEGFVRGGL